MGLGKISIGNIIGSGDMTGILYGIGTGPGDPELVTRKAWRIVAAAPVVAYPAPEGGRALPAVSSLKQSAQMLPKSRWQCR